MGAPTKSSDLDPFSFTKEALFPLHWCSDRSMASLLPIKPLDGPGDYLRWKESLLLRARTLGVARVLFAARPAVYDDAAAQPAADKWALDDALCRGHILAALSDRLLPDYARHATAAELWRALARTYDVHVREDCENKFNEFCFEESPGEIFLEQIAHAEALGAAAGLSDDAMALALGKKLPPLVSECLAICSGDSSLNEKGMESVWNLSRSFVLAGVGPEYLWKTQPATPEHEEGCSDDDPMPEQNTASGKHGMSGHVDRNCRRKP